ncbi:tandem-95 repeat protein [Vibrio parahaemolyticus]|uniref:tandem-95 repeat protein n=1 Tax=Vibrio parahaemolyticus TaxID=670 RepID=UPI001E432B6D|nr:tandem-95 repeat protein [Vibrio parahaemolyticus]
MTSTDVGPLDLNVQLTQEQGSKDVTDDVLQIISAIEQGQDPSAVDEEFAPAAGENGGSSLQTSATIVRDGTELLASTSFETIGIESLGLSQTQVLALNDLFRSNLQTSADSTDKPLATTPVTLDAIEEDGGSIIITTEELLSNVDDEDKDTLSVENLIIDKGNGTLVDNGDGTWTFTPQIDDDTEVSFTFDIIDDEDLVVSGSANLDILPINDAPNAKNDVITTEEDTAVTIDVLVNDSDVEGDVLSIQSASVPSEQGSVDIVDGKLVFTPAENFNGEATITYIVTDGDLTDEANVTVTVTPVNDSPVAVDDTVSTQEDTVVTIDVLPNDSDVDGDKLSIQSASVPKEQGTVEVVDGKLVFTPAENFNGHAEITYTVTDGELTDEAKVTVTVNPVNDAPTIKVDAVESITEDAVNTDTVVATLTVRDTDTPEDQLTVSLENNSNGYFVLVGNEVKLTQAGVDAVNNDELNLKDLTISASVSDGVNPTANDSDSLVVNRVNDAPTVENAIADQVLSEDFDAYTIDLNEVFKDSDSSLEFSVSGNNSIQISIVNGVATITPTADWNGKETITFTAKDPSGESVNQTVDFTVAPVVDIEADSADVVEDTPTIINVLGNDTFESTDKVVSLDAENGPKNGTVIVNNDGTVTYTPDDNYVGEDTFTYIVTSGGVSESTTVEVNVTPVNDAPVAKDDIATTQEDTAVTIDVLPNDSDVDGDKLSIQSATVPEAQGKVEIVDGKLVFTPAENFNGDAEITYTVTDGPTADRNGSETLTFTATDPSGESISQTVNFTVAPVADIVADKATVVEDTPTIIKVLGNDTFEDDGKVVSLDTNNGPANGTVSVNPDGSVTYTPNDNYVGKDTFTYIVTSGGVSESTTVEVNVTPVNDAPVAKDDIATTQEDTAVTIDVLPNDTDVDGDKLSIESVSVPKEQGTVEVVDGKLVFTPAENFNGDAEITYTVTDGALADQATVKVTVKAVNDTPVVESNIADQTLAEDFTPYTIDLNTAFSDVDNVDGELTFSVSGNSNIQVAIVNGIATITPTADWNGSETLTFTATDPSGESISQPVNFTVAPVADIVADKATVVEDTPTIIKVLGNDTFEGDGKVVSLDTNNGPANGTVSVNPDGSVTYTPNDNYQGTDSFTYIVTSGGVSESTTVSVDVTPVNDAPVAKDDIATTQEDTAVTIDVLPNDTDVDGDKLSIQSASVPEAQGKVEIVDGKLVFTPAENFNGDAEITYTVTDGQLTDEAKVTVTVNPVNDAPTIKVDAVESITEDAVSTDTVVATLTVRDTDTPEDQLTVSLENNSNGYFVLVGNEVKLTQAGVDAVNNDELNLKDLTISASVSDGVNPTANDSDSLVVNRVNDAPTIKVDAVESITEDAVSTDTVVATLTVRDTDTPEDQLTVSLENNSNGYFVLVGNEVKLTQAGVDAVNNDELNLKDLTISASVSDGVNPTANDSDSLVVNRVNDAPTIKVDAVESITEDAVNTDTVVATLTVRDTDTPEDQLTVSLENNSNGYFVLVGDEVKLTQAGVDAVNNDELNLKDLTISASVSDGVNPTANDSDSLIVNRVNDAPTVENAIADQELSEDFATYTIDLNDAFKDSDSALNFSVSGNSNVLVSIENGIATISPTADWNGSETLTFTATDPSGESISQTVNFTVAPVVDIEADSADVVEDTPTIINVLGNDTFESTDKVVSLDADNGPKNGTVIVNNDGTVTYTPDDNYVGKDTFTYVVTSGGVSESTTVTVNVTPVNDKPESEDFTHVADDQLTQVVFDTDTKPLGSGDSKDHIADVEDDLKGNDLYVRITELPTSGTLFFKDSDGELHEIKEVSDTLYDKDSLYYEADNVGFLLGIKDRPNTPNGSESTSDFNNWGLSEDGGPSHSRTEHLANGASITISSDSGELAQYNRQVSHIGNGIADNDGQGIEKGETITIDLSNNPVGSVNLGLDGLGGLFDYGDDNAALITVTYLDSNNVQQTQTFEFLKPEGNFMLFQETSVGYGKDLALPEGSVITQLDFSTKNEGNWELRYVEGVPAEDSFGYVAVDSESGVSDPSTVNIVNEMLDGNVAENGPAVQSITGVTVVEGDNVTFSVSLNNATDQTVKYQVDFSAEGSSTSSQDIDLSNATFTNGVKYLGGYLIVPAGVNGFEITIPSIDDQLVESTESLVIKVGDVSGVGYIDDNDVPPTVQSNEISGLEDEAIVITLEHLGVVDSGVNVEFDTSALNGSLQVKGPDGWEVVSGSVLASDIESGLVRYVPAEHESGADVFDKDGVGNGLDTYEQIHFTVSDGNSSASGTLSIDIEPVADPIKIDLTFGPVTSVPVTLGGSWSTDEELKDLLEASNLPGLDFEHVVTQAFNNGHAGNDLMLSGDTESPLSFVGDQQAGANVDAQGSDIFVTGGGNDSIYGGIGSLDDQAETDTVVYSGKLSDYDFSYYPASDHSEVPYWIVEDSRFIDTKDVVSSTHKESGDHLYEIEQLIFQDAIIKLDNNTGEYVVLTEQQVSFELNLDLIDVDGSESFINDSVTLTGIPSGLTLEVNGKTVTENSDGSYTVDLSSEPNQTSHQLSGTITVPADYNGSLDFDVTATAGSVEVNNNTQMGADTASVSVRDYEFVSGTHGDNNIVGSDDNDVIVGDVQGLQIVEGQDYNIAFMLDTSGSMGYDVGRAVTELKTVLNTLIESASGPHSGKVNVLLTTFSTESKQVLELDLSSDNAKSQVESILDAIVKLGDGNTNYEAGFQSALNWFENADSGATNLSYFISDGRPNQATSKQITHIRHWKNLVRFDRSVLVMT